MDVVVGAQATAATRGGTRSHLDALCIGLVFVAGVTLCMQVFSSNRLGARPQIEDEFVYLFQAKTLANGHLTYPSPPLPEFFEAAHLLVVPRFAAKYLPGHALVLLPFLASALIAGFYSKAATGSWTTAPWSLYARQYMPYDGPGIGGFHEPAVERGFPPHLRGLHDRFLESRERHTWARFPQVVLRRLKIVAQLAPSWGLIPFAIAGLLWTPLWSAW